MDKDELLIRDLLEQGVLQKAPDNFTGRVMQAIEKEEREPAMNYTPWIAAAVFILSAAMLAAIMYMIDPGFIIRFGGYFSNMAAQSLQPFQEVLDGFRRMDFSFPFHGPVMGIVLAIILLLAGDRLVRTRRNIAGMLA